MSDTASDVTQGGHGFAPSIVEVLSRDPPRVGSFRIIKQLGEGGFAPVFLASEEYGGQELRTVALKLFALDDVTRLGATTDTSARTARDRIVEEARSLCRVEHPGIVRFYQLIEEGTVLGLAMECVRGVSVQTTLDRQGTIPLDTALVIAASVASALATVHAAGLIHRDVKPDNVIQTGGQYKLIDFGIAVGRQRPAPPASAQRPAVWTPESGTNRTFVMQGSPGGMTEPAQATGTNEIAGTMGYIDPACLGSGEPADASSDLYSLGAMLYECLSGRLPSSSGTGQDSMKLQMPIALGHSVAPPLKSVAPHVPDDVARLVDALVAPRREDRPKRAEWVASELERLRRLAKMGAPRALPQGGPFRGLDAFDEGDRDILMGRTAELASALEVLRLRGVLALVGASGSGKTSFARAGVVPAVVEGALGSWPSHWTTISLTPGPDACASLARAFNMRYEHVAATPLAAMLTRRVEADGVGILLLIDALEELVTMSHPATRGPLLALIEDLAANPRPGLRAIVTLRRDLLDPLLGLGPLGQALTRGAQLVAPLSAHSQALALEERLAAYGFALEDRQMRDMLAAELTATAESMPLVEFALARLWMERDNARRILPRAALTRIGGIAGALEQHAEATVVGLVRQFGPSILETLRHVLLALTTPQGTRTRATLEEVARSAPDQRRDAVVEALERARLVLREDGRLTLAHEALLLQWNRLRYWTQEARRERELVAEVERAAARWKASSLPDHLLRGRTLAEARRVRPGVYTPDAVKFIAASRSFESRSRAGVLALVASVLVAAGIFAVLYMDTQRRAEKEKRAARNFTAALTSARNTPESERAREIAALLKEKRACEKALEKYVGDAGVPSATGMPSATPASP